LLPRKTNDMIGGKGLIVIMEKGQSGEKAVGTILEGRQRERSW